MDYLFDVTVRCRKQGQRRGPFETVQVEVVAQSMDQAIAQGKARVEAAGYHNLRNVTAARIKSLTVAQVMDHAGVPSLFDTV